MKKILLFSFTLLTLNSYADRSPATSPEPNENKSRSSRSEERSMTDAGTTVLGLNCADCKAMEVAGKASLLNNTSTIYRGSDSTSSEASEAVKSGQ